MKLDFDVRRNMSTFDYYYSKIRRLNKLHDINIARKLIANWQDVILFRLGIKRSFTMKLRNGKGIYINSMEAYNNFWQSGDALKFLNDEFKSSIELKGHRVDIDEGKHLLKINIFGKDLYFYFDDERQKSNTIALLIENFIDEQFKELDVRGHDVVDIGASVGDTAIYFALRGAKRVYAYEPYPYSYKIAEKNIAINSLNSKISLFNKGCGKKGIITIKSSTKNSPGTDLKEERSGDKIEILTLADIVKENYLSSALLKVDCEGCEYPLILDAEDETLRHFKQIILEYHYGYRNLKEKLERAGFSVKVSRPTYFFDTDAEHDRFVGIIKATIKH
jgi:FkbM family methyltransferase